MNKNEWDLLNEAITNYDKTNNAVIIVYCIVVVTLICIPIVDYILKRRIKPSKDEIEEIRNLKFNRVIGYISLGAMMASFVLNLREYIIAASILSFIFLLILIQRGCLFRYIKRENVSSETKKYFVWETAYVVFIGVVLFCVFAYIDSLL